MDRLGTDSLGSHHASDRVHTRTRCGRTLRTEMPPLAWPGSMSEELAWAGGFFDGEGSTCLDKHRSHSGYVVPVLYVPQSADVGIAPELLRLKDAVGLWNDLRNSRIEAATEALSSLAGLYRREGPPRLHLLWPFIGQVKRLQARRALATVDGQLDLSRGDPAFGVAGSRFCLRRHDKWTARQRPYVARGKDNGPNDRRQCLECVRADARAKRIRRNGQ
jgi:hypothetical protein